MIQPNYLQKWYIICDNIVVSMTTCDLRWYNFLQKKKSLRGLIQSLFICIYQCHLKVVFGPWLPGFTCLVQQCRPVWRRPCCLLHLVQAGGQAAHSGPDCASVATSTNNSRCYTTKSTLSSKWQTVRIASVLALSLVSMSWFSFNLVLGGLGQF